MSPSHDSPAAGVAPDVLVRILRHEVGGLLQTIYSCVAILQQRLPASADFERGAVATLRSQAEACKNLLDAVHDFLMPPTLSCAALNLSELAATIAARVAPRFAHLEVKAVADGAVRITGDAQALSLMGNFLLLRACNGARHKVTIRTAPGPTAGEAEWTVTHDGPAMPNEQLDPFVQALVVPRDGRLLLGLAPAGQVVRRHGGRLEAFNLPEGGFCIRVILPEKPPPETADRTA